MLCFTEATVRSSKAVNMATGMRITAALSLVLVLVSQSRVFSAQLPVSLPVPVACFERCPPGDDDCIDVCQRQIESETRGEFPAGGAEKRASAFVRIGRPALDRRTSSFIRIGKREGPVDGFVDKRKDSFVRIGRASAFVRIGRGRNDDTRKRTSSFVRIGKSSDPADSPIEVDTTGKKRMSSSFVRIGRGDPAMETGEGWLPRQAE